MVPTVYNQTVETLTIEPELPDGLEFNRLIQNGVLGLTREQSKVSHRTNQFLPHVTATDSDTGQTSTVVVNFNH